MKSGYRFGLALSAIGVLLAYKAVAIAKLSPVPILLGALLESVSLALLYLLAELLAKSAGRARAITANVLFFSFFYVIVVSSLAHTFFFESAAERRFSLLEVDLRTLGFFFRSVLPVRGALLIAGLLAAIHLLAVALARLSAVRLGRVAAGFTVASLMLALALAQRPRVPSPLADMAAGIWEGLTTPEIAIDHARPPRYDPAQLDKSAPEALADLQLPYEKVIVFVMETMTAEMFAREAAELPRSTFVHRAVPHVHQFGRYFATNQDSRTGMLSMLGSRFIPYESYTEAGRDGYMYLGKKSSLVDLFSKLGYRTAFAVSQRELELVVSDLPWDETIHLAEGDTERLSDRYLCFVPYEFEHSCEDRALLPRVLDLIDRNERLFLYQEFIWGHASEYNKASGKTNTEYYSAYIDAVIAHLTERGQLDKTLIVLTSDHGFRDKGLQTSRAVYELPLWFYAPGFAPRRDARLFSHLDFKDLLLAELIPGRAAPSESPYVMVVGPTGTSFLAVLTQPGAFMLLKSQGSSHYLVHAEGHATKAEAEGSAADFLRLYEDYVMGFAKNGLEGGRAVVP